VRLDGEHHEISVTEVGDFVTETKKPANEGRIAVEVRVDSMLALGLARIPGDDCRPTTSDC
jgi:hypothetical protein